MDEDKKPEAMVASPELKNDPSSIIVCNMTYVAEPKHHVLNAETGKIGAVFNV